MFEDDGIVSDLRQKVKYAEADKLQTARLAFSRVKEDLYKDLKERAGAGYSTMKVNTNNLPDVFSNNPKLFVKLVEELGFDVIHHPTMEYIVRLDWGRKI